MLLERLSALAPHGRRTNLEPERSFVCNDRGCSPREGAVLALPALPRVTGGGALRLVLAVEGAAGAELRVGAERFILAGGAQDVSMSLPPGTRELPVALVGEGSLVGIIVVPATDEVPAPPPEPWEPGEGESGAAE
ncbi:MAG: hypothetical protein H5U40_06110 [Polyangiaceae bacterium]|nr:hypothetical protein [Polyangiaceae bacterium]